MNDREVLLNDKFFNYFVFVCSSENVCLDRKKNYTKKKWFYNAAMFSFEMKSSCEKNSLKARG